LAWQRSQSASALAAISRCLNCQSLRCIILQMKAVRDYAASISANSITRFGSRLKKVRTSSTKGSRHFLCLAVKKGSVGLLKKSSHVQENYYRACNTPSVDIFLVVCDVQKETCSARSSSRAGTETNTPGFTGPQHVTARTAASEMAACPRAAKLGAS